MLRGEERSLFPPDDLELPCQPSASAKMLEKAKKHDSMVACLLLSLSHYQESVGNALLSLFLSHPPSFSFQNKLLVLKLIRKCLWVAGQVYKGQRTTGIMGTKTNNPNHTNLGKCSARQKVAGMLHKAGKGRQGAHAFFMLLKSQTTEASCCCYNGLVCSQSQ